jgi:hypothetical protein
LLRYIIDDDSNLDIFEMLININELAKDLVNWKLLKISCECKKYQMPFGVVEKT